MSEWNKQPLSDGGELTEYWEQQAFLLLYFPSRWLNEDQLKTEVLHFASSLPCCHVDVMECVTSSPEHTHTAHALTWFLRQPNHSSFLLTACCKTCSAKGPHAYLENTGKSKRAARRLRAPSGPRWTTIAFAFLCLFFQLKPAGLASACVSHES